MEENDIERQIIEAASKIFLEKGYNEVNMSQIADEAGISRPTLYYYFRTKDKIFQAVFGDIVKTFVPKVVDILHTDIPAKEKLSTLMLTYLDNFLEHPGMPMFIVKEIQRDPSHLIQTVFDLQLDNYFNDLINAYQTEIRKGTMKEVPFFVLFFTIYGLLTTPFISCNLVSCLFLTPSEANALPCQEGKPIASWHVSADFRDLIEKWKPYLISQVENLLLVQ